MAKRKQSPSLDPEILRAAGWMVLGILGIVLTGMAAAAFLRVMCASSLFTIREIVVAPNIQPLDLKDLSKLKGQNLFSLDLAKVEARVRARYPQLADLRVTRRLPDQVLVSALKREPFAKVSMDGRSCVVDRSGFMIGPPIEGQEGLTLIKGLKRQRIVVGEPLHDEKFRVAAGIITVFKGDSRLLSVGLEAVKMDDLTRIVCDLKMEESEFELIIDRENIAGRLKTFSEVLSRGGLDLAQIKYMDLRFGEPVIGQKKAKK